MCKKQLAALLALTACVVPFVASAGSAPDNVPAKAKELHCVVGKWKVKGTLTAGDTKAPISGKMRCESISGGFGVGCETTLLGIPGMEKYEERDLWGYDAGADTYHMFSVTNGGETHDHAGKMTKDGWSGTYEGTVEGKPMVEKVTFRFTGDDEMVVESVVTIGGQQASALHATLVR